MKVEFKYASQVELEWLQENDKHVSSALLKSKIDERQIIVVQVDGVLVGWLRFGLFWDEIPFMNMLMVDSALRGKGIGRQLVEYWEDEMEKKGHKLVMTSTQTDEEAQHFYRKIGYADAGSFTLPKEPSELVLIKEL